MLFREYTKKHHLNIYHDASESSRELVSVWSKIYRDIEKLSHNCKIDPTIEFIPLSKGDALALVLTGKDLFLGIYDDKKKLYFKQHDVR